MVPVLSDMYGRIFNAGQQVQQEPGTPANDNADDNNSAGSALDRQRSLPQPPLEPTLPPGCVPLLETHGYAHRRHTQQRRGRSTSFAGTQSGHCTAMGRQSSEPPAVGSSSGDVVLRPVSPLRPSAVLARLLLVLLAAPLLLLGLHATLLLVLAAAALLSCTHGHWRRAGVPHHRPLPLVGSLGPLLLHATSPPHLLADLHLNPPAAHRDCPLVGFYIFDRPALLVRDPDLVRQLLVKDFADFPDRHTEARPEDSMGCLNMFGARAALWRRLRAATSPAFTGARMRGMLPQVDRCACAMVQRLLETGAGGTQPVKVRDVASRCITDILTSCLFGVEGGALSGESRGWNDAVRGVFGFSPRRALEVLSVFVAPQLRPLRLFAPRFFGAAPESFYRHAFAELSEHRRSAAETGKPAHVLDMLMAFARREGGLELCTAQASILVTAGSETTATTLTCCLYELAANPALQERLRHEVREGLGPLPSYQQIAAMTYLHMVVAETLRKYPALPYVERRCRRPRSLDACAGSGAGVPLEAGTPLFVSTLGLHHDPRFFPQPDRFDPERFSEDACRTRHPYCYAPFGHGPRSCVGMRLGLLAVKLCVARVVSSLRVSLAPDTPQLRTSALSLLLTPVGGVPLIFTPLRDQS
ncbi:cytochrome P450 6k1-like [Schistocerca cancellata]|uniref:cytochrome P450 6k1-like n=1 Tax=Schistocerca cancellata TaxID=274614 RepID=UPI002117507B|nr:cytochrome P450 6k1-like [Schistocerca cancellata]